jgi:hypothetical protein
MARLRMEDVGSSCPDPRLSPLSFAISCLLFLLWDYITFVKNGGLSIEGLFKQGTAERQ